MPRIIIGAYLMVGMAHVMSRFMGLTGVDVYTKPLLMPLLIFLLYRVADGNITLPRLLLATALLFSWIGDLLLMGAGEIYFLGGLASFLMTQILYAITLYKSTYERPRLRLIYLIPIVIYGAMLLSKILPSADELRVPIVVYALGILSMVFIASTRHGYTSRLSYFSALVGAALFVISDSLIAIDKFYLPSPFSDVLVMGTYIPAQLMLVWGVLRHNP